MSSRRPPGLAASLLAALAAIALPARAGQPPAELRVLLVGNSLTYTNNLPALLRAVGASQGVAITTETYAAPGGNLAERWKDGHVERALRERHFDAVVLQEQGGHLAACMASAQEQRKAPCAASMRAYSSIFRLARDKGARPLVFATWGPDDRWQGRLDRATQIVARENEASVFNAAGVLRRLKEAQPGVPLFPDNTHPSIQGSLALALALYRQLAGTAPAPKALRITAPLLPVDAAVSPDSPLESQPSLAGDGKATVVPVELVEPLVRALPDPSGEMGPARRDRR